MSRVHSYYAILELPLNSSTEAVKQAYRNLVKRWHPDLFHHNPEEQKQAEVTFKKIVEAYEFLKDYQPGNIDSVDSIFSQKIKTQKAHPETHYQKGIIFAEKEQHQEAIAEFSQAIAIDENYIKAYQYRGFVLDKLGFKNRAEADLRKAAELKLKQIVKEPKHKSYTTKKSSPPHQDNTNFQSQKTSSQKKSQDDSIFTPKNTVESNFVSPWKFVCNFLGDKKDKITAMAISYDQKLFTIASNDDLIEIWQYNSKQPIITLRNHKNTVNCLIFTPDDQFIISGSSDKTIIIWDLKSQKSRILGSPSARHSQAILSLAISPDGKTLVSGSADKTVKIWQLDKGGDPYTLTGYFAEVSSIAISPNGEIFASGGLAKNIKIRSLETGKLIHSFASNSGVLSVAFSSDSKLLATGGFDGNIKIWNIETGTEIATLTGHLDRVCCVIFSPDGTQLISASWDQKIKVWKLDTKTEICTLKEHSEAVIGISLSADGKTMISGSVDGTVKIWQSV